VKINSKDYRVRPGAKVKLNKWPTTVKPFCKSKKRYQKLLEEHVEQLSSLQQLHYASNRYALLLIFQGMTATDSEVAKRTWLVPMDEMTKTKTGPTHRRHIVAIVTLVSHIAGEDKRHWENFPKL